MTMQHDRPIQLQPQYVVATAPKKGFAVTALVTGIVGLVFAWVPFLGLILGIIASAFGGIGLYNAQHGKAGGKGMAIAGLVMGMITVALFGLFLAIGIAYG